MNAAPQMHWDDRSARMAALLGKPRAMILVSLDRPATIGGLAELLFAVPSAATHHAAVLEAAGLVRRERRGRNVVVRRTPRGSALVALYGAPAPTEPPVPASPPRG